jgi:hypothetical protein
LLQPSNSTVLALQQRRAVCKDCPLFVFSRYYSGMEERDYKLAFAKLLQRLSKDLRSLPQPLIAKEIVGKEQTELYPQYVLRIAEEWIHDEVVLAEVDRLDRLPIEREVVIQNLYQIATGLTVPYVDRVRAFSEIGKIMGWGLVKKDDGTEFTDRMKELSEMVLGSPNGTV